MTGKQLKRTLKKIGMKQIELAAKTGVTKTQVSRWINDPCVSVPDYATTIVVALSIIKLMKSIRLSEITIEEEDFGRYAVSGIKIDGQQFEFNEYVDEQNQLDRTSENMWSMNGTYELRDFLRTIIADEDHLAHLVEELGKHIYDLVQEKMG